MTRVGSGVAKIGGVVLLLAIAAAAWAVPKPGKPPGPSIEGPFGAALPSPEEFASYPKALPPGAIAARRHLSSPPSRFKISDKDLPHVEAQGTPQVPGSPGSCEAWSAGYAMGSYTANITNKKPIKNKKHTVSPGFIYPFVLNEAGSTCPGDTLAADTLNYLVKNTAPSLHTVPYQPSCTYLGSVDLDQSCTTNPDFCTDLSIGSWSTLGTPVGADALPLAKGYLAQGRMVQISIVVPWEFVHYTGGVYDAPSTCPPSMPSCAQYGSIACIAGSTSTGCAQHGVVIVGYDDKKKDPATGVRGAVRIMNSFGHQWGEHGFMWMSYSTFEAIYLSSTLAEPPSTSTAAGLAVTDAFQWVARRPGEAPRTHLIFEAVLGEPVKLGEVTITAPAPDGQTVAQTHGHQFRNGHLYITRHDGRQFQAGTYTLRVQGTNAAGAPFDDSFSVHVGLAAAEPLTPANIAAGITGSNGQIVH